jgi:hypothetical protein
MSAASVATHAVRAYSADHPRRWSLGDVPRLQRSLRGERAEHVMDPSTVGGWSVDGWGDRVG